MAVELTVRLRCIKYLLCAVNSLFVVSAAAYNLYNTRVFFTYIFLSQLRRIVYLPCTMHPIFPESIHMLICSVYIRVLLYIYYLELIFFQDLIKTILLRVFFLFSIFFFEYVHLSIHINSRRFDHRRWAWRAFYELIKKNIAQRSIIFAWKRRIFWRVFCSCWEIFIILQWWVKNWWTSWTTVDDDLLCIICREKYYQLPNFLQFIRAKFLTITHMHDLIRNI